VSSEPGPFEIEIADEVLRAFNVTPSGGHFAAFEEPELFSNDLLAFIGGVEAGGG
jgi:hypothetical protein